MIIQARRGKGVAGACALPTKGAARTQAEKTTGWGETAATG